VDEVRALLNARVEACRIKDIDRLMSLYSCDAVYFDVVPPLRFAGPEAVRGNFVRWFDGHQGPIDLETRELQIAASGDVAFAHMLHRDTSAMRSDGGAEDERSSRSPWLRSTVCCRRSDHSWLITHEHVSLPVEIGTPHGPSGTR
jgi:ketosteroid isomerase-like protein